MTLDLALEPQRRRLVRLCAVLSGDVDAAEDLAQETMIIAWRKAHALRDPGATERWLNAIARNVCRRWGRRRSRDARATAPLDADAPVLDDLDVEVELEREELAELLDRALAQLPADTRDVLVQRYVDGSSHAEIAARVGVSADAISMRLSRGKIVLRRVLASELREEASAYGLIDAAAEGWRPTRVWCTACGRHRLLARLDPEAVSFRCPGCSDAAPSARFALDNPYFASLVGDLVRPSAILARAARWSRRYFAQGTAAEDLTCTRCGAPVALERYARPGEARGGCAGLHARCAACGEQVSSSLHGIALASEEVERFRRDHPRIELRPDREVDRAGQAAILVRCAELGGPAGVDVLFARDTLRVLEIHRAN